MIINFDSGDEFLFRFSNVEVGLLRGVFVASASVLIGCFASSGSLEGTLLIEFVGDVSGITRVRKSEIVFAASFV